MTRLQMNGLRILALTTLLTSPLLAATLLAADVSDPGQGPVLLPAGITGASELSGISWAGGDSWWAVSDNVSAAARVYPVTISLNPDGTINGTPVLGDAVILAAGSDPEGIAVVPNVPEIIAVSDEVGPEIRFFSTVDGSLINQATIPTIFTGVRTNLGLEALAFGPDASLWTANEEALITDGDVSSLTEGTIVRIQRFNSSTVAADGQWGYLTDPLSGDVIFSAPGRDIEVSGVADLNVLADGTVVVLERAFGAIDGSGTPGFRIRLYEVDFTGADDTSAITNLSLGSFLPVAKTLLFESITGPSTPDNFEGLGLGPFLANGGSVLMLVGDDCDGQPGFEPQQSLRSLVEESIRFGDGFETGNVSRWSASVP